MIKTIFAYIGVLATCGGVVLFLAWCSFKLERMVKYREEDTCGKEACTTSTHEATTSNAFRD